MARRTKANAPKAGYGNGSVYEEPEGSGHWRAELNGVRRRARSEAEANEKLKLLQDRRDGRLKLKLGSLTLAEWLRIWLDDYCSHLKPKTLEGYRHVVQTYIDPYDIARIRLEDLDADDIVRWMATLRRKRVMRTARGGELKPTDKKLSNNTIAIAFRRLRKALATAKTHKLIGENVGANVEPPPSATEREPVILEPEQVIRFLATWAEHRLYTLFAVFVTVGLRRGELLGLRWKDVDLDARTITVRGQLQWLKPESDGTRRPTWVPSAKTKAGRRVIDISKELAEILKTWRRTQREERLILGPKWHGEDYVFTNEHGGPTNPRTLSRTFKAGLKRAKLSEEMTLHDLRHCAGSLMLERGEDIQAVSELLGHSSRAVTERIYAHALRNRKRKAGESLGFLLRREA
jgi:integrase